MSSEQKFDRVFVSIRDQLARFVSRMVPPKEIEDVVQETYVRVCQMSNKDAIRSPRSFMFKTARNLAIDYLKRAELRLTSPLSEDGSAETMHRGSGQDGTYECVASDEEFVLFCRVVRGLPVQIRRAFVLKKVYGYSIKEIAEEMDISTNTARNYVGIGLKRCTQAMLDAETGESRSKAARR